MPSYPIPPPTSPNNTLIGDGMRCDIQKVLMIDGILERKKN
jgi:hypothetical protein